MITVWLEPEEEGRKRGKEKEKKEEKKKKKKERDSAVDTRFFGRYEIGNRSCSNGMQMKP